VLLAVGVYAGSQAGQEHRAVLQPTEPVVASQGFDVESAADRRELRSLPRGTPGRTSAAREKAVPAPQPSEGEPAETTPPGESAEEEPLLSAEVPGVTTVEVSGTDDERLLELDEAEALLP
jgi:hypothetical protein